MRLIDILRIAFKVLRKNLLRTALTTGGIAVGIGSMVFLISLGLGLQEITVTSIARSDALLTLDILPGPRELKELNNDTVELIKNFEGVEGVWPRRTLSAKVYLGEKKTDLTVVAVSPSFLHLEGTNLISGRLYHDDDDAAMVVSSGFLRVFGLPETETPLVTFKVEFTGLDEKKEPIVVNSIDHFSAIGVIENQAAVIGYVPLTFTDQLNYQFGPYEKIKVKVSSVEVLQRMKEEIVGRGYSVITVVDKVEEVENVFRWIKIILGFLGVIAVTVASIGMFNTLTISFLERTKEISIMKTLGATDRDIWRFFIWEAIILGLIGGAAGIFVAYFAQQMTMIIMHLLARLVQGQAVEMFTTPPIVVIEFIIFAVIIAMITGFYPALRARRLKPLEAIRGE